MSGVITSIPPLVEQPPGTVKQSRRLAGRNLHCRNTNVAADLTGLQTFNYGTFRFAGSTSGFTYLQATAIAFGTLSLPAVSGTDTLLSNTNVAIVTNKSIDGLQNTLTNIPTGALDADLQALAALNTTGYRLEPRPIHGRFDRLRLAL